MGRQFLVSEGTACFLEGYSQREIVFWKKAYYNEKRLTNQMRIRRCAMEQKTELPMGIENFARIRRDGFYYIDKTGLIRDLLENRAYVNLFTRPRRFGKTLNMSMLKCFFELGCESALFDGLEITKEKEL